MSSATSAPGNVEDDALAKSYNDVPYTSSPDPARHPDRLATIGMLFGLDVAPSTRAASWSLHAGTARTW